MHKEEIQREMMMPCAPEYRAAEDSREPVCGNFEIETKLAVWIASNHLAEVFETQCYAIGIALVTPSLGCEKGKFTSIEGSGLHVFIIEAGHSPVGGRNHIRVVGKVQRHVSRLVVVDDSERDRNAGSDFGHGNDECWGAGRRRVWGGCSHGCETPWLRQRSILLVKYPNLAEPVTKKIESCDEC